MQYKGMGHNECSVTKLVTMMQCNGIGHNECSIKE